MAKQFKVTLDRGGVAAILKGSASASMVNDAVGKIAANVDVPSGGKVITDAYTTDRAAGVVILAHPLGAAIEAKHGLLTKAAAAAGVEVTGYR